MDMLKTIEDWLIFGPEVVLQALRSELPEKLGCPAAASPTSTMVSIGGV